MPSTPMRLGIISALQQEQTGLIAAIQNQETINRGMRDYVSGNLWGIDSVCVLSRIGKVGAAATVATLIERFNVTHIIFTGVAGAADPSIAVGDIVIADELVQHDMNCVPLFPRFEIPLIGISHFSTDRYLTDLLDQTAQEFIHQDFQQVINMPERSFLKSGQPRIHRGLIASGDEFISSSDRHAALKIDFPHLLAVEMEGAAVAQVCFEFGVPFAVIRTISDHANEDSAHDFMQFIHHVAAPYAYNIIKRVCSNY